MKLLREQVATSVTLSNAYGSSIVLPRTLRAPHPFQIEVVTPNTVSKVAIHRCTRQGLKERPPLHRGDAGDQRCSYLLHAIGRDTFGTPGHADVRRVRPARNRSAKGYEYAGTDPP